MKIATGGIKIRRDGSRRWVAAEDVYEHARRWLEARRDDPQWAKFWRDGRLIGVGQFYPF